MTILNQIGNEFHSGILMGKEFQECNGVSRKPSVPGTTLGGARKTILISNLILNNSTKVLRDGRGFGEGCA